ncbi:MAG: hypothetical protein LBV59_20835 [Sphingobacterium sp.]|uniref:hypothetical protein n=1 Tax=Sphingobacterium sp. TaxID=341027 RepID=UPI00284CE66B|nr:hypothetical protein [Sphingobacterium sp.]MDR3010394.1 hypothetical protein [Sphingobacterium sp.]
MFLDIRLKTKLLFSLRDPLSNGQQEHAGRFSVQDRKDVSITYVIHKNQKLNCASSSSQEEIDSNSLYLLKDNGKAGIGTFLWCFPM